MSRSESLKQSWRNRPDYIGDIKHPKIYNIWRSIRFTKKGNLIGCSEEWKEYRTFYNDIKDYYEEGNRLVRLDKSLPFSKDNFTFMSDKESSNYKNNNILLTYNKETKTLLEWSLKVNRSLYGIRNRYYKYKNITSEEILFGKKKVPIRKLLSTDELEYQQIKDKASKMCSSYRIKDIKSRREYDLDPKWFIDNILYKECVYCGTTNNIGCDRIDNNIGHIKTNVLPCCYICNTVRNNHFTVDEMKILGKTIKEIRDSKQQEFTIEIV
jgi:hypothetical protein